VTGRWSLAVGLAVAVLQTCAVALAAGLTGSVAMRTQTVTSIADVAVGVFLVVGVTRSGRPPDDRHPLGYGRERFFWSFIAAAGIFIGGVGAAVAETVRALLDPQPASSYLVGYAVLAVVMLLDAAALWAGLSPVVPRARQRNLSVVRFLWRGTDPTTTTLCLSSLAGLAGGVVAFAGLAGREITGSASIDVLASSLIGLVLLVTSLLLLHTSRELLTGRGVATDVVDAMKRVVSGQPGIIEVPDLFAIVVGAGSLVVDGDVVFDDGLDVPRVEAAIVDIAAALRAEWPSVVYVYLNPVAAHRDRRGAEPPVGTRPPPSSDLQGAIPGVTGQGAGGD
jgi:cation diffusion facilitator family transporter